MAKYIKNYGKVIAIIGQSSKGEILNPVYIMDELHAINTFESGDLITAYKNAINSGAEDIYLIRINYNTDREKFEQYKNAYSTLEGLDIDIIVPLNFTLSEYIVDYPNYLLKKQQFHTDGKTQYFKTSNTIEKIEYVLVNNTKINNYQYDKDGITINNIIPKDNTVTVKYYTYPQIDIEFSVFAIKNNKIIDSKKINFNFDQENGKEQKTDFKPKELFNKDGDIKYFVKNKSNYFDIYTPDTGDDYIYLLFKKDNFISDNTFYKYFIKELSVYCSLLDAIAVVKPDDGNIYSKNNNIAYMKEILNQDIDYGKYITCSPSNINYFYKSDNAQIAYAALISRYSSNTSVTNKSLRNVQLVNDYSLNEVDLLTKYGYTVFYNSVRNGLVPFKALTLASNKNYYKSLKIIRIVNEISKRIKAQTEKFIGKNTTSIINSLEEDIRTVINNIKNEGKITDGKFEVKQIDLKKLEIELELWVQSELDTIKSNLTADIA